MNKSIAAILVAIIALAGIGGFFLLSDDSDTKGQTTTQNTSETESVKDVPAANENTNTPQAALPNSVEIENMAFKQNNISVKKGTTVTWTNKDDVQHNINPDQPSDSFKGSELLNKGETYSFTFDTAGTYTYHCTPHPFMKGTITVTE